MVKLKKGGKMTKKTIITAGKLDVAGMKKVGKGALIAGAGAILSYLTANIANLDFGSWTPVIVAGYGILANFAHKWLTHYESK
jgi:hypothetical protein